MRKKEKQNEKWIVKTFRIKSDSIFLYNFLEFYILYVKDMDISKDETFDMIINNSIKYIAKHNIKITYAREKVKRLVKGFSLKKETLDILENLFNEYENMFKAEVIEFLINLYLKNNVKKQEALPFIKNLDKQISNIPDF